MISSGEEAKTTTIPNVVGMSEADAEKALQDKNLVVKKGDPVYSDNVEQGEVVSVSPSEGAEVKEGTTVTLVISKGNQPATVPKLTGKSQSDAEAALSQAGLSGNATEDYSDTVEEGVIISFAFVSCVTFSTLSSYLSIFALFLLTINTTNNTSIRITILKHNNK